MAPPSKACDQCRRRRVRCDESRPRCFRCVKAKLICGGYRPFEVIRYEFDAVAGRKLLREATTGTDADAATAADADIDPNTGDPVESSSEGLQLSYQSGSKGDSTSSILPSLSNLQLDSDTNYLNFTHVHLFNSGTAGPYIRTPLGKEGDLSQRSLVALSTYFYGNEHQMRPLTEHGLKLYGKVIKDLNEALGDKDKRLTFDVFTAVQMMALFEQLTSSTYVGWVAHCCGLERLVELCGPRAFSTPQELRVFERLRPDIIFASMASRKTTIMAGQQWKTIPWERDPKSKNLLECLRDTLADSSNLLCLRDQIVAELRQAERNRLAEILFNEIQSVLTQLKDWKIRWDTTEKDCCVEYHGPVNSLLATSWPASRSKLWYKSIYHARTVCLYNALVILTEQTLIELERMDLVRTPSGPTPPTRSHIAAIDICRSIHYCVETGQGGMATLNNIFGIRMAWRVLEVGEPELGAWLKETLYDFQHNLTGRWAIAGYALNLGTPNK